MKISVPWTSTAGVIVLCAGCIGAVMQPFAGASSSTPPAVDSSRLLGHVRHLSVDLHPRSHDHPQNLDRAAEYIVKEFTAAGAVTRIDEYMVDGQKYRNVIARFGPTDGPLRIIGAHYDSHSHGAVETSTPGADDNASGVAGLLELAHLLGRSPQARSIELVAYTLEEPPYFRTEQMGSFRHAHELKEAGKQVEFMLALEMIGYFSDKAGSQKFPIPGMSYLYADRGDFIGLIGNLTNFSLSRRIKSAMLGATTLPVYSINAPAAMSGIDFSDHLNYWREGFPAFMVTDTAFMRNPNYHLPGDTFDKLDYARMAMVVQGVYAVTQQAPAP